MGAFSLAEVAAKLVLAVGGAALFIAYYGEIQAVLFLLGLIYSELAVEHATGRSR